MFEFLIIFFSFAFGLALMSAIGIIVIHKIFGPEPPPRIQMLADLFMAILNTSAKVILGPFELFKRINISIGSPPQPPTLPTESSKIAEQVEGGHTLTKLLAAPENLHE
jgi:hypothetical protein